MRNQILNVSGTYHKFIFNNLPLAVISCDESGKWYAVKVKPLGNGPACDYKAIGEKIFMSREDALSETVLMGLFS